MRTKVDVCPSCGSEELFSGWFDEDGYAVPLGQGEKTPAGVEWMTSCNSCGHLGAHKEVVAKRKP